jgi:hypothetical protein
MTYIRNKLCSEDYETAANKFCVSAKMKGAGIEHYKEIGNLNIFTKPVF